MSRCKFKIGDKVRLRKDAKSDRRLQLTKCMRDEAEGGFIVDNITRHEGSYGVRHREINIWYMQEWLEPYMIKNVIGGKLI